ncbi:glycoside hydrolase family 27 protein [Oerskovia flava]|uniref:glycoside hydrolase family 27 protein n=1 Tax=Oerskovia flava TaxID=2986422 RepID=UPI002240D1B7|nr:glycoside hydrolase family 27 protein [Oerskovia sp. JB1-3-2]
MPSRAAAYPPMGWNSWDCFGTTVTEAEVLANADVLAARLSPTGWDTVVVDIQWYEPTARAGGYNVDAPLLLDGHGFPRPDPARFPSAGGGDGFAPLAAQVHARGLRFGLHLMRGIPRRAVEADLPVPGTTYRASDIADRSSTCPWNGDNYGLDHTHPGAQAWLDALMHQIIGWGVDLLKVDDMLAPYQAAAVEAYALAVRRAERAHGRDVVLSLSPGTDLSLAHLDHLRAHADMWRVCDDLWDRWGDVEAQLARLARWAPHQGPDGWADGDMLPLGRIGTRAERGQDRDSALTRDERRTLLTAWSLARSPLMVGGDLTRTDDETLADLANAEVLELLRHSTGGAELLREDDVVVWGAAGTGPRAGSRWAAVISTAAEPRTVTLPAASVGFTGLRTSSSPLVARDLWSGEPVTLVPPTAAHGGDHALTLDVPAHGTRLLRLDPGPAS